MEFFYGVPFLLVTDKDFLNYIMNVKPMLARDVSYEFTKRFLGEGLGNAHRKRLFMSLIFNTSHVWKCCSDEVEEIEKIVKSSFQCSITRKVCGSFRWPMPRTYRTIAGRSRK